MAPAPDVLLGRRVDDNCFPCVARASGAMAWLHASWTEWKNLFSFEIMGRDGKLQIDGLGGSYGVERLTFYRMTPAMGPPETTSWEYPFPDRSWHDEFASSSPRSASAASRSATSTTPSPRSTSSARSIEGPDMIIARAPLRVTLGGGGTDLPSYYRDHEGFLVAAAIDKYVYITIHQTFVEDLIVKYSQLERVPMRRRSSIRWCARRSTWSASTAAISR
jgi:hypothetical protein